MTAWLLVLIATMATGETHIAWVGPFPGAIPCEAFLARNQARLESSAAAKYEDAASREIRCMPAQEYKDIHEQSLQDVAA